MTIQPPEGVGGYGGPEQTTHAAPDAPPYPGVPMQRSVENTWYPGPASPPPAAPAPGGAEARRGRGTMVVIAVLLVMLLGMGGWFAAYKIKTDDTIAAREKRIEKLQSDLKSQADELRTTKDDLTKTENELEDTYDCLDAVDDLLNSADEAAARKAVRAMLKEC